MSSDKDKQLSVGCEISINMRAFTQTTSRTHTDQLPNGCIVGHSKLDVLNLITNGMNWQVVVMYLSQMAWLKYITTGQKWRKMLFLD